jgi:hypothetical protein
VRLHNARCIRVSPISALTLASPFAFAFAPIGCELWVRCWLGFAKLLGPKSLSKDSVVSQCFLCAFVSWV